MGQYLKADRLKHSFRSSGMQESVTLIKKTLAASAICMTLTATAFASDVFINEIHYDNVGDDTGEAIEVAGTAGTDLTGWTLVFYNGSNSASTGKKSYKTAILGGVLPNQQDSFGTLSFDVSGIQNGSPDAIALVDDNGAVLQFLSYEGSFTALNGPAIDLTSTDIGASETSSTPVGHSLQLSGLGTKYEDFTWQAAGVSTFGAINTGQSFGDAIVDLAPTVLSISPANGATNVATDANIVVNFSEAVVVSAWNVIDCVNEGSITVTASGEGTSYTLDPDSDFASADSCSFTISASDVTDLDDDPDILAEDVTVTFDVLDTSVIVNLVINEFHADPAANLPGDANGDGTRNSSADEFIEIVNFGETDFDVSGWTISDGYSIRHTFPEGSIIEDGCAVVLFGGSTPVGVFGGSLVQTASTGSVGLNNGGDTITLSNGVSTFEVVYGSEGGKNQSLTLSPDMTGESFVLHSTIETAGGALYSPGMQLDGSKFAGCTIPDIAPIVANVSPADGAMDVSIDSIISLSFSEAVAVSEWPNLSCSVSGDVALNGALSGVDFTLTPAAALSGSETCTLTLLASSVVDMDGNPDSLIADFTTSFTTAEMLVCAAPETYTLISEVQGSGSASDLVGQSVTVQAVVTAVISDDKGDTIVIQEENNQHDSDSTTSEGIFVFNEANAFTTPAVGDVVTVKGNVSEFFDRTQITLTSAPLVCGDATISATPFGLPVNTLDDLEALEGMLVTSSHALVVTDNYGLGRFGQVTLSSERLFSPTSKFAPGSAQATDLEAANALNRIVLDDGDSTQNPELVVFPTGGLSAANSLRLGDTVSALTGVMDYSFGEYRVIPTEDPTFASTNPRTAAPDLNLGNLKVASLNVLNYFNNIDTGDVCGPTGESSCRGADSDLEFERQKAKTVAAIVAMNADIVGLMEIENNGFSAGSAIDDLVAAINADPIMGEGTYSIVNPGTTIGTDAITVAFIYKSSVVSLSGAAQILDSSNSISDENGVLFVDTKNRPALVQEFALLENGETLVISVNHLKSKGSSCGAGDDDTTTGQGNCNLTRTRAAQALSAFLDAQFPDTATLIIGDLNSHAKEDPISALEEAGYTNLVNYFGGDQAYSYTFSGLSGYLDHALANNKALAKVVDVTEWHINADEPISLDYNVEFQTPDNVTDYYADDAYRMSDHDPVLIALQLDVMETESGADADVNGDGSIDFSDYFAILNMYGSVTGDANFDAIADYNADGVIGAADIQAWYLLYINQ
ncbi:MAG: ExeM/NucH family extracellular endonuclease [Colwellia sp.]|nr:ExeM/NucH family extracellular endonuclease [Colwellia sp.]